ncbi:MAG: HNH endonuclease [Pseudomonadota bacterium]
MNDTCLICHKHKELNLEHIIPQCLGGRLKKRLYCVDCNSKLGHEIDIELAKNFGRYATLLNVGREGGENQPFIMIDENDGTTLTFDGKKFSRAAPDIKINKDDDGNLERVEVTARSTQELNKIFTSIAKKYNLDLNLVVFDQQHNPPPTSVHEFYLDTESIHKAVAKIAYGFACWKLPKEIILSSSFLKIKNFLKNDIDEKLVSSNFTHTGFMTDNLRPLHKIHLSFNRHEKLVIGYVALFGAFRYTVLLSDSFESGIEWPAIDYTFNPITQKEVPAKLSFTAPRLSKEQVVNPKQSKAMTLNSLGMGMTIISEYSKSLLQVSVDQD